MKSKNIYGLPADRKKIIYVVRDSPAHKIYNINGKVYDLTKAIDFTVKEGTKILAALEGKVVSIFNRVDNDKTWNKTSEPPKKFMKQEEQDGNYVVVEHVKGELSIYCHLRLNEINVKEGDRVRTGYIIGSSGNTGWSMGPHIHLVIFDYPKENNGGYRSLEPSWEKGIKEFIDKKAISYKELPKKYLK